jgi:TRAP-type C4-dicarboxylate transport system substrate-binding protein
MDQIIIDGLHDGGFVTFGLAEGGFAYIMSKAPIRSAGDLRKHKIWVPEEDDMSMATAKSFGVTPIPLSIAEVRTALQTGLIDTVAISPIGAVALQWHTQVDYVTDSPMIYLYAVLAIERRAFNKISPADKKIVSDVIGRTFKEIDRINREDNIKAMKVLRNQGIQFIKPSKSEQIEWAELAHAVPRRMIEQGSLSQDILDKFEQFLKDYRSKGSESDG